MRQVVRLSLPPSVPRDIQRRGIPKIDCTREGRGSVVSVAVNLVAIVYCIGKLLDRWIGRVWSKCLLLLCRRVFAWGQRSMKMLSPAAKGHVQ